MPSTKALGPDALTCLRKSLALMSSRAARRFAESAAWAAVSPVLSSPTWRTGRGTTNGWSLAPRMGPRSAWRVVSTRRSPSFSDGSTIVGSHFTSQASPSGVEPLLSRTVVS